MKRAATSGSKPVAEPLAQRPVDVREPGRDRPSRDARTAMKLVTAGNRPAASRW